jgi:hypothetical protein
MHDDEELSSSSLYVLVTCSIGTEEHDDEELFVVVTLKLVALGQKSTCQTLKKT